MTSIAEQLQKLEAKRKELEQQMKDEEAMEKFEELKENGLKMLEKYNQEGACFVQRRPPGSAPRPSGFGMHIGSKRRHFKTLAEERGHLRTLSERRFNVIYALLAKQEEQIKKLLMLLLNIVDLIGDCV